MFVSRAIDGIAGGVERMITRVMNELVRRGHQVSLFTWDRREAVSFYPLDDSVMWHRLDMGSHVGKAGTLLRLKRASAVRSIVARERPELLVCFQDGPFMAMMAYTVGMGIPLVAAERNAPTRFEHTTGSRAETVSNFMFRFARRLLIQVEDYRRYYPAALQPKITTIPNPVMPVSLAGKSAPRAPGRFRLLSVGRLSYQKNYGALVDAFSRIAGTNADWDLVIVGEGDNRPDLEAQIRRLGLEDRVLLPGATKEIDTWYRSSDLFCLSARWEGFPNALGEALAFGLPSVGYENCAGVRDLIHHESNGLLAAGNGDAESLAEALDRLMQSTMLREEYAAAARQSVLPFAPNRIFDLWETTLLECAKR